MLIYRRIMIASISFIFFMTPMVATAIPITYEFDAVDVAYVNPTFSGSITIESSATLSAYIPAYPGGVAGTDLGAYFYADAIVRTTLNYGSTSYSWLGGSISSGCTYTDSYFDIIPDTALMLSISMPTCLPGADQLDLSNFDLTVLNDVILFGDHALSHPGTSQYSPEAYPFNFRRVTPVPEPTVFMLITLGIVAMGFVRRRKNLS